MRFRLNHVIIIIVILCCIFLIVFHEVHDKGGDNAKHRSPLRGFDQLIANADRVKTEQDGVIDMYHMPREDTTLKDKPIDLTDNGSQDSLYSNLTAISESVADTADINVPDVVQDSVELTADPPTVTDVIKTDEQEDMTTESVASYIEVSTPDEAAEVETISVPIASTGAPVGVIESRVRFSAKADIVVQESGRPLFPRLAQLYGTARLREIQEASDSPEGGELFYAQDKSTSSTASSNGGSDSSPFAFRILERFHRALNTGDACADRKAEYADGTRDGLLASVAALVESSPPTALIEFAGRGEVLSAKAVAHQVASANPAIAALFVNGESVGPSTGSSIGSVDTVCSQVTRGGNLFISTSAAATNAQLDLLTDRSGGSALQCVQVVHGLGSLVGDQLPHEFEESLGNLLCRCGHTYLPKTLPPDDPYFALWEHSVAELVAAAVRAATVAGGSQCALSTDMSDSNSAHISPVRYTHVIVQRGSDYRGGGPSDAAASSAGPYLPVGLLSSLPLDSASALSLANAVTTYFGGTSSRAAQTLRNATVTHVLQTDESGAGSTTRTVVFDVDFGPQVLEEWAATLAVRGGLVLDAFDGLPDVTAARKQLRKELRGQQGRRTNDGSAVPTETAGNHGDATHNAGLSFGSSSDIETDAPSLVVSPPAPEEAEMGGAMREEAADASIGIVSGITGASSPGSNESSSLSVGGPELVTTDTSVSRRLYAVSRSSSSSSSSSSSYSSSSSSRSSSSSGSGGGRSKEPPVPYSLSWELPESAAAGDQSGGDLDDVLKREIEALRSEGARQSSGGSLGSAAYSRQYSVSVADRRLHRLLQEREDASYQLWLHYLQLRTQPSSSAVPAESGLAQAQRARLVYVLGAQTSLLSIKLAKSLASRSDATTSEGDRAPGGASAARAPGLVVSVLSDGSAAELHEQMTRLLGLRNNIVCVPNWRSIAQVAALLGSPERADITVVQSDVVANVIRMALEEASSAASGLPSLESTALLIEEAVAALLLLADTSFVEVPSPALVRYLLLSTHPQWPALAEYLSVRYGRRGDLLSLSAAQLPFGFAASIEQLPQPPAGSTDGADVAHGQDVFRVALTRAPDRVVGGARVNSLTGADSFWSKGSMFGLSVYTASHFGLAGEQRRVALNMLANLPAWNLGSAPAAGTLVPWRLFLRLSRSRDSSASPAELSLWLHDIHSSAMRGDGRGGGAGASLSRHAAIVAARLSHGEVDAQGSSVGISVAANSAENDRTQGGAVWRALNSELRSHSGELAGGKFSFVEHNSGFGFVSTRLALAYPNATVISLERNERKVRHHASLAKRLDARNNAVCLKTSEDSAIHRNLYESPELFRFQLRSHSLIEDFAAAPTIRDWGESIGTLLSVALTTFIYAPSAAQVSWAMHLLYGEVYRRHEAPPVDGGSGGVYFSRAVIRGSYRPLSDVLGADSQSQNAGTDTLRRLGQLGDLMSSQHPQLPYRDFESKWLLEAARVSGGLTTMMVSPLTTQSDHDVHSSGGGDADSYRRRLSIPLVRCDVVNMTRHVHHHYEYSRDGHTRTYTMRVQVNDSLSEELRGRLGDPSQARSVQLVDGVQLSTQRPEGLIYNGSHQLSVDARGGASVQLPPGCHPNQHRAVSVRLHRDKDGFPIPYTSIYGVTLITALRLGLEEAQRDALFGRFLSLPLYEDMAPWNVVLMGRGLDYIDYDTRHVTYTLDVPRAYRVMSVLMNYKRTVEDFRRCASKAPTVYGLPYVSDCVGGSHIDKSLTCPELSLPVPCGDGACHSDYISCLRSLSAEAERLAEADRASGQLATGQQQLADQASLENSLAAAMRSMVGRFDGRSYSALKYEEFEKDLRQEQKM